MGGTRACDRSSPGWGGTTFREYVEEDGRGIELHGIVTEFVPNKRFAVHLESNINTVDVSFVLVDRQGMTRLIQNVELRLKGLMKLVGCILRLPIQKKIRAQAHRDFTKLKKLCEQRGDS